MPPPVIPPPEFALYGRYGLNVETRKVPGIVYYHDMEALTMDCGMGVPPGKISRFNNQDWATYKGFQPCRFCILPL